MIEVGESYQQGVHFMPIVGGRAGYKCVKITFPFPFFVLGNGKNVTHGATKSPPANPTQLEPSLLFVFYCWHL